MKLSDFDVLSFDCYGTLIDWETGIVRALKAWLEREGVTDDAGKVLEMFARHETRQEEKNPRMLYRDLLGELLKEMAAHWGVKCTDEDAEAFGRSVGDWPAFPDSPPSLRYLKQHYKLVILSNVDRRSFKTSNERLGVAFDAIYTAEDIGSYKPDPANFRYMLQHLPQDLGMDSPKILHTAQSLFHDHVPAKSLGLPTMWIDRRHGREDGGATPPPPPEAKPDFEAVSLADLVAQHKSCLAG